MVKYVKNRSDQLRIVKSCHVDATSGHFGVKKTVARIKERFLWKGVWKDAKDLVKLLRACLHYYIYTCIYRLPAAINVRG